MIDKQSNKNQNYITSKNINIYLTKQEGNGCNLTQQRYNVAARKGLSMTVLPSIKKADISGSSNEAVEYGNMCLRPEQTEIQRYFSESIKLFRSSEIKFSKIYT